MARGQQMSEPTDGTTPGVPEPAAYGAYVAPGAAPESAPEAPARSGDLLGGVLAGVIAAAVGAALWEIGRAHV
jgi:hypothetical protein